MPVRVEKACSGKLNRMRNRIMWRFSICILVLHPFFMDRLFIYISACARRYLGLYLRISPGVPGDISALALDSYAFK